MKIDFKNCSEKELWKFVASHLQKNGIDTILVGGAVVSIYTDGLYKSGDLDFILGNLINKDLPKYMNELGFIKKGRHYVHPDCTHLFVEFPGTIPLGIGEDYSIKPDEHQVDGQVIIDVSTVFELKLKALAAHKSQPLEHFTKMAVILGSLWGNRGGVDKAEAFDPVPILGVLPSLTRL